MTISRRSFLKGAALLPASSLIGCSTAEFGSNQSYLSQVLDPANNNAVYFWLDIAMQQIRDQRIAPPRAAYNFGMPTAAGFLAANAVDQQYEEHFGIGRAPANVNPEIAYGVAFSYAAAEVFQQPFLFERNRFLRGFANDDQKSASVKWGRQVAKQIIRQRNDDGSEPSEVNYYLDRYQRRADSLKWSPTGPFYAATPGPAFGSFARGLFPGHGQIKPWTMNSNAQFRVREFYDPQSPEFANEFDMIKRLGGADSTIRTNDQAEIALFWEDGPWGITPPGHFLYIAVQVLQNREDSFIDVARNFALLGMTQC
ncbi:MAG: twin-arginine translocation signal domain-containing protein, partial [Pseudomonadota bacterium]